MKTMTSFLIAACALLVSARPANAQDVQDLLQAADRYRLAAENMQVDTVVDSRKVDGSPDKERAYRVFAQAGRKSLVLMQSPAEKGQKVLMLGDDFWLLMPASSRPMRITPMQKLLGDAAVGDIATVSWAGDYSGERVGEEPCAAEGLPPPAAGAPATCLHLSLRAARKGVSYQRIELWLGLPRHEPVHADLYVQSDKLAKQAWFVMDQAATPSQVSEMGLIDRLGNGKKTFIRYQGRKPHRVPDEWLNPMFLSQNPALE